MTITDNNGTQIDFDAAVNLTEKLNFSDQKQSESAIKIKKWHDVNHYETLCMYVADNDIDITSVSDDDFYAASEVMAQHGQQDKSTDHYWFWIDA